MSGLIGSRGPGGEEMNKDNYASLEASKRLVNAEIVLETEAAWCEYTKGNWSIGYAELIKESNRFLHNKCKRAVLPAPSMAEVWRELPEDMVVRLEHITGLTHVDTAAGGEVITFSEHKPTDALIDLLIWVRKGATE